MRIQILAHLARGERYILQLVNELGEPQQVVHRHLKFLEKSGLVRGSMRPYEEYREQGTPPSRRRKYYSIDHTISINIDIGPFLFFHDVKLLSMSTFKLLPQEMKKDLTRIEEIKAKPEQFSQLYQKWILLEKQNQEIVHQKHLLLTQRHYIQERVKSLLNALFTEPQDIEIAYQIFARKYANVDSLARELDIHPKSIQKVLDVLKNHIDFEFMTKE